VTPNHGLHAFRIAANGRSSRHRSSECQLIWRYWTGIATACRSWRVIAIIRRWHAIAATFTPVIKVRELEIDILNRTVRAGGSELR
jgi:hypothetical protein